MGPPLAWRLGGREPWVRAGAAAILGVAACLLAGALRAPNLPLDDSYIHLSYGIDFDPRALFSFQAGRRDTGTSSWLWTSIAVVVAQLRLPEYVALTLLSMGTFCVLLAVAMGLVARALPRDLPFQPIWPVASALLLVASGNVLWLSLSGMETGLFVLLLLCAVPRILAGRGMTVGAGLLALLLVWTRIEGVIWLGLAAAVVPFTGPRAARRQWRGWLLPLAGLALYAAYNLRVGGHLLPSSGRSKRDTFIPGGHAWREEWVFVTLLLRNYLRPLVPGLVLELPATAVAGLSLLGLALARALRRRRVQLDPAVAAVGVLVGGAFVHAAVNVVEFRSAYHHLRYFAPVLFLVPLFSPTLVLLALRAVGRLAARLVALPLAGPAARWGGAGAAAVLLGSAFARELLRAPFWASLYRRNAEQLAAVHLAVGRYLRASAPPGTRRVASFDIGALRWASHLEIVDLAGTSDERTLGYQRAHRQADLIRDTHAELYVAIENGFDFVAEHQPTYDLELLQTWQFPEYFDPFPPHSRRMVLYRVNHCGEPRAHRERTGAALSFELDPADARARAATGTAEGSSFSRWPAVAADLGHPVALARGRFLASDADPLRDRAVGRFETVPMKAGGDFLSFRLAGGHDARRLRVDLLVGGAVVASWTGFDADSFLEIVHPIAELRGQTFTLALVDESRGPWGHLMLDEIHQFTWRTLPPRPCPAAPPR